MIFCFETICKFGVFSSSNKGSISSRFADGAIVRFLHERIAKIVSAAPVQYFKISLRNSFAITVLPS